MLTRTRTDDKKKKKLNQNKKGRCSNQRNIRFYLGGASSEAISPVPRFGADFVFCTHFCPCKSEERKYMWKNREKVERKDWSFKALKNVILCLCYPSLWQLTTAPPVSPSEHSM